MLPTNARELGLVPSHFLLSLDLAEAETMAMGIVI